MTMYAMNNPVYNHIKSLQVTISTKHRSPNPPHADPKPNQSKHHSSDHDHNNLALALKRITNLQPCNLPNLLIQMPTLLPLLPLALILRPIQLGCLGRNSVIGLDVPSGAAAAPGRVVVVLVGFWVEPGGREQVGEVGGGRGVGGGAAGAVLGVDEEEGEQEGGEEDGGEDDLWEVGG
jgi:hypothetical protein